MFSPRIVALARKGTARFTLAAAAALAAAFTFVAATPVGAQGAPSRGATATSASVPLVQSRPLGTGNCLTGLDVLMQKKFAPLRGKRVGLLTNASAISRGGTPIVQIMQRQRSFKLAALFSPEHGLYGNVDTRVADTRDAATGLVVHSLYSGTTEGRKTSHHPRNRDVRGLDVVVIDMQDIGARYYTYLSYMAYMMEVAAEEGVPVMVLDRPNPIGGDYIDGPIQDFDVQRTVTAYFPMPIAHGMTMGEMAQMFNREYNINCQLRVVRCKNWRRKQYLDETGLRWVNPSPNIQNLDAAIAYPGIAMFEAIASMGRGTDRPFHVWGTPYIERPEALVDYLKKVPELKGCELAVADFTPTGTLARGHAGERRPCRGVELKITDRTQFRAYVYGLACMAWMQENYGNKMTTDTERAKGAGRAADAARQVPLFDLRKVRGPVTSWVVMRATEGKKLSETLAVIGNQVAEFKRRRAPYLLYR